MKKQTIVIAIAALFLLPLAAFSQAKKKAMKVEQLNTNNFHLVDFVGWNHSVEVLANYHTKDVKVFGDGWSTVGMDAHEKYIHTALEQSQNIKIVQHFPNVAKGEWTGVVGSLAAPGVKMATAAKWKNGQIAEEYLFMAQVPDAEAKALQLPAKPIFSITNVNDKELANTVDLQAGWSTIMGEVGGKRTIFFIKKEAGKEVERLVFR